MKDKYLTKNVLKTGIAVLALLTFLISCAEENERTSGKEGQTLLNFDMTRSPQDIINHMEVYMFQTSWDFIRKVQGVQPGTTSVSMQMDTGTWNFALLTAETPFSSGVVLPVAGTGRTGKMWENHPTAGELPSAPELRTGYLASQYVAPNVPTHTSPALDLYRNVAKVRVYIEKTRGLDVNGIHRLELHDVPTTLNWAGGLYPDQEHPATASAMKGIFAVSAKADDPNMQESNKIEFIIPAHKGTDFLSPSPTDTTKHKMTLSIDLACVGGTRYQKANVEIPKVPRVNGILDVKLSMLGELEIQADIIDWVDVDVPAELDQTRLLVNKAEVGMAYKDTIYVNTDADDFSFTVGATGTSWLTAQRIGTTNAIELTANVYSYVDNSPRSTFIDVKANNVTKRIPVTQRPEKGTITAPETFWVSPSIGNTTRTITVNSKGPWVMTTPNPATVTPNITAGNEGSTNIVFTRKVHTGVVADYSPYYGNSVFTIKNTQTLEIITVTAQNLFLQVDDLDVPNAIGTNTKENIDKVICMGGSTAAFSIVSKPVWVTTATINPSGSITLVAQGDPTGERREDTMTFCHNDDPTYTVTVNVIQDFLITIPPFDYFVIKFTWQTLDAEVKVQFEGNNMSYDGQPFTGAANTNNKWVGFNVSTQTYNGSALLQWGGDATGGQGETVFFNAPIIDNDSSSPRFVKLVAYCYWYSSSSGNVGSPIRSTIFAYKGGIMKPVSPNFINEGGTMLYTTSKQQRVNALGSSSILNPDKLVEIVYDRIKHSANIEFVGFELNTPLLPTPTQ